ncbi:MAG: hypothetical protein WDO24_11800 [Pseudomonadota bacterium]
MCTLIGFAGFDIWRGHQDAIEDASRTSQNLARTLEEHADGIFRRADLMLSSVAQATLQPGGGPDSATTMALIAAYAALLHPQETLILVDATGTVRFDPRDPVGHPNLADRDYFLVHRDRPGNDLFASSSLVSFAGPSRFVGLSRRLTTVDGHFAGIIVYAVGGAYFRELYSSLNIGAASNVTLWDGAAARVLARFPPDERVMGRSFEIGELFERVQGERVGQFSSVSPLDGVNRLVSYRKLTDAPFVVSVGLAETDYLRRWRDSLPGGRGRHPRDPGAERLAALSAEPLGGQRAASRRRGRQCSGRDLPAPGRCQRAAVLSVGQRRHLRPARLHRRSGRCATTHCSPTRSSRTTGNPTSRC